MLARFPAQPTRFVGRTHELADIGSRLASPDCRLLTLTGAGGSGKTRLAVEAGKAAASGFADGALFVALQPLDQSDLLVPTIAHAAGFSFYRLDDLQTQLFDYLRDRQMILLLDNFEHLLDGAGLVSDILSHAPGVKALVTSRESLSLQEEWLFPVKGMETPLSIDALALESYEAVQLFVALARRIQPDFNLDDAREAVARIVQIAAGLPLAIELAASWLKGLSAADIAREMQHNLDFLSTTTRNVEERHRSIRAAFDQSWKLLSEAERLAFARLSVFRGGFQREAAEEVAGVDLPGLAALVEKSLLTKQSADRWTVHELLRQYGQEQLAALGLAEDARTAHCRTYAAFIQGCEPALKGPDQLDILVDIERDFENIRMAWGWAIQAGHEDLLAQMLNSLYQWGFYRNRFRETAELFDHALARVADERLRGRLLSRRWGYLHWWFLRDYTEALDQLGRSLDIATAAGDTFETAFSKLMIGYALLNSRQFVRARQVLGESQALFHDLGDPFYECWVMYRIGYTYFNQADFEQAIAWTQRGLDLARSAPNRYALGNCLYNLAGSYLMIGDFEQGQSYCEQALVIVQEVGHQGQVSLVTSLLALAVFFQGDFAQARRHAEDARRIGQEIIAHIYQAYPLSLLAVLACVEEDYAQAEQLAGQVQTSATNALGVQFYTWGRSMLACGLGDLLAARQYIRDGLRLSLKEHSLPIEYALIPASAVVLAEEQPQRAARLLSWLDASPSASASWPRRWPLIDRLRAALGERLGQAAFAAETRRGQALTWEAVLAELAAEFDALPAEPLPASPLDEPLTQRELDVLQLLATGLTNSEIAERLVIGVGTVKTHAQNIYAKLDVGNRTQAIVRARDLGLLP